METDKSKWKRDMGAYLWKRNNFQMIQKIVVKSRKAVSP